ncbi:GNAT family N-acetyltransferase [Pseudomonas sp. GOM7]|uniref:GNAT family N-acetyltransferase n=1 Tax=Pseudomonas sp. GOM7 TaxID=2998079 RepID=UPI00227B268B|nr:GNAT family N-acetyltransferase [Pseudomonas sp. GOM7]WAJ37033.1 GNAT family N-acetyltransferase [Pseudomonas sp. GOM7]
MLVTAATPSDLSDLVPLFAAYLRFYEVPRGAEDIHAFLGARLAQGDAQLLIARDEGGRAQGFVQLYPFHSSLALRPAWLLSDLYVEEHARRAGVGEALMNAARAHAEAHGACGLQLETAKTNLAGQRLYERLGYIRDEQFFTYWLALGDQSTGTQ